MTGWIIGAIVAVVIVWLAVRHQERLRKRAYIMQEAMRNRDFAFRLPTRGLLWGERAMQEALNNVGLELQRQVAASEVESWQRLTRVLTHEIMNATAPIASISQALLAREDVGGTPLEDGIRAIHETSVGLKTFVENYRRLAQLQVAHPTDVKLGEMVEGIAGMYPAVAWHVDIAPDIVVRADAGMLRQVMINLAKNAIEAGAHKIEAVAAGGNLMVSNDGTPIMPEVRRDIFTPFFTTKDSGSGIGLSLSRQAMVMQGGGLVLCDAARPGYQVTFLLSF